MKKLILLAILASIGIGGYMLLTKEDDSGKQSKNRDAKSWNKEKNASSSKPASDANSEKQKKKPENKKDFASNKERPNAESNSQTDKNTKPDSKQSSKATPTSETTSTATPEKKEQNRRPGSNSPQNAAFQMQRALSNSSRNRQNLSSNATQIESVKLLKDNYSPQLPILAKIQAKVTDSITAPASVRVISVNVNSGDIVEKGQLLVELDATDIQLSITTQKAVVAQQESNIRKVKLQHENNLVLLENANKNYEKEKNLLKIGFTDNNALESATDKLRSAQLTVDLFKEEKISLEANLTSAKVNLQKLQTQLDEYLIKAPYDGKVINLNAFVNQKLKNGDSVITLIDQNSLIASGQIPASKHKLLSLTQTKASLESSNQTMQLALTYLANNADRGAVDVEFLLMENSSFVVGDTVELNISLKPELSFIVPSDSLYQGQYIYSINSDNKLQQTKVNIIGYQFRNDQQWTLIQSNDLKDGDQILATRLSSPATGTNVNVVKELEL